MIKPSRRTSRASPARFASSAVLTGLIIAAIAIPVAWATGFLKPPVVAEAAGPARSRI